jgi:hypothetical protein
MGYDHYWKRQTEIEAHLFERIVLDFERLILPLEDAGVSLAGFNGLGLPEIDHSAIVFNGVQECGHPHNPDISIPFPCERAGGIDSSRDAIDSSNPLFVELKHRACNGSCRCESFNLPRVVGGGYRDPDENGS